MKVIICENYEEASQKAADIMLEVVKNKPTANLGLATGSTPIKMYELMVKDHKENGTSYQDIKPTPEATKKVIPQLIKPPSPHLPCSLALTKEKVEKRQKS